MRPDPPAPTWFIRLVIGMMLYELACLVYSLCLGAWIWAVVNALLVMVNAVNAYFSTLPLSARVRILGFNKGLLTRRMGRCMP